MTTDTLDTLATVGDNSGHKLGEFTKRVSKYGAADGKGGTARVAFGLDALSLADDNLIGPDDADRYHTMYVEAAAKARGDVFVKQPSHKVQVSKFRQILVMGAMPIDAVKLANRAIDLRAVMAADDAQSKSLSSPYDDLVKVARAQIAKGDTPLTDDEIKQVYSPKVKADKDESELLEALLKRASAIYEGDDDKGVVGYKSPELLTAMEQIAARLQVLNPAPVAAEIAH